MILKIEIRLGIIKYNYFNIVNLYNIIQKNNFLVFIIFKSMK